MQHDTMNHTTNLKMVTLRPHGFTKIIGWAYIPDPNDTVTELQCTREMFLNPFKKLALDTHPVKTSKPSNDVV